MRAVADPLAPAFAVVPFDIENAPKQERVQEAPKKKEKKPAAAAASTSEAAPAAADKPAAAEKQTAKKEKKEKKPKEGKSLVYWSLRRKIAHEVALGQPTEKKVKEKKAAPAPEEPAEPAPSMIDLRVGRIVEGM